MASIKYPAGCDTKEQKLKVAEELAEVLRLEDNAECAGKSSSYAKERFANELHPQMRAVHAEINANAAWLWNDKEQGFIKQKIAGPNIWNSSLSWLQGVTLGGVVPPDPVKDFTTGILADPGGDFTIEAHKITYTGFVRNVDAWVYFVNPISGDFEHLLDIKQDSTDDAGRAVVWALTNIVNDFKYIRDNSGDSLNLMWWDSAGTLNLRLMEVDGGTSYADSNTADVSLGAKVYVKNKRDESVGTYGTLYCYMYSDSGRTTLLDTLSVALHSSKKDFQNVFAIQSDNVPNVSECAGTVENLDLQEGIVVLRRRSAPRVVHQPGAIPSVIKDTRITRTVGGGTPPPKVVKG